MSWGDWIVGWLVLAVQVGAAAVAGNGLRRRLAPQTSGAPVAAVATAICAVSVVVVTSLVLGSAGLFRAWAVPPVLVVLAVVLDPGRRPWRATASTAAAAPDDGADGSADGGEDEGRGDPYASEGWFTRWVAWAAVVMVAASWVERVVAVYRRGTTDGDSLTYHLPFAARFVQTGWTTGTEAIGPDAWVAFYPANVELVEAWLMLPFGGDAAVPLMNLAWLALALGAAWAIGATTGRASVGTALAGVVLALPLLAATQGGTARVDVATIALVLSTVAVLLARPLTTGSAAVAGLALGLTIGAKFALLPLAGVMLVTVAAVLWRRRSWPPAAAWTAGAALTAGYWYVRNWWVTGSPVPAIDLRLGPVGFAPVPDDRLALLEGTSIVDHVDRPGFWGNIARPAAEQFTGTPLVAIGLGVVAVAAVVLVARQRPLGVRQAVAAAAVVGCVAYPFAPYSAPIVGHPTTNPIVVLIVALNVRYLLPPLIVLLCLVPIGLAGLSRRIGDVAVVVATATTALLWRRSLSFDAEWPTTTDDAVLGTVVVLLAAAVVAGLRAPARRGATSRRWATGGVAVVGAVTAVALSLPAAGEDDRLHSYRAMPSELVALWRATDEFDGERVALLGGWLQYPHMGAELGTEVDYVGVPRGRGVTDPPTDCAELDGVLAAEDYAAVVVQQSTYTDGQAAVRDVQCLRERAGAMLVVDNGAGAVFAL
jgi:hypothetical protein